MRLQQDLCHMQAQMEAMERELAESRALAESSAAAQQAKADLQVSELQAHIQSLEAAAEELRQQHDATLQAAQAEHAQHTQRLTSQLEELGSQLEHEKQCAADARSAQERAEGAVAEQAQARDTAVSDAASATQRLDAETLKVWLCFVSIPNLC